MVRNQKSHKPLSQKYRKELQITAINLHDKVLYCLRHSPNFYKLANLYMFTARHVMEIVLTLFVHQWMNLHTFILRNNKESRRCCFLNCCLINSYSYKSFKLFSYRTLYSQRNILNFNHKNIKDTETSYEIEKTNE